VCEVIDRPNRTSDSHNENLSVAIMTFYRDGW